MVAAGRTARRSQSIWPRKRRQRQRSIREDPQPKRDHRALVVAARGDGRYLPLLSFALRPKRTRKEPGYLKQAEQPCREGVKAVTDEKGNTLCSVWIAESRGIRPSFKTAYLPKVRE